MNAQNRRPIIRSLQGLRVLAFLAIFLSHAIDSPTGSWGVSIFIMLSGFVMVYSYWDRWNEKGTLSIKESILFSIRKIRPLYPLHIITLVAVFIPYYLIQLINNFSLNELLKNVFKLIITVPLIQAWFPAGFEAINTVAWYLSAMLFLYAVFPFVFSKLRKEQSTKKLICYMAVAYSLQIVFAFASQRIPYLKNAHWSCYIFPAFRLGDFFIGCSLGSLFIRRGKEELPFITATTLEALLLDAAVLSMLIMLDKQRNWFTYTLLYVPSSVGLIYLFAQSEGGVSHLLQNTVLQRAAMLTPFAFLIHRPVLHYVEDGYKLATGNSIHPILLVSLAGMITLFLSIVYMKYLHRKK